MSGSYSLPESVLKNSWTNSCVYVRFFKILAMFSWPGQFLAITSYNHRPTGCCPPAAPVCRTWVWPVAQLVGQWNFKWYCFSASYPGSSAFQFAIWIETIRTNWQIDSNRFSFPKNRTIQFDHNLTTLYSRCQIIHLIFLLFAIIPYYKSTAADWKARKRWVMIMMTDSTCALPLPTYLLTYPTHACLHSPCPGVCYR